MPLKITGGIDCIRWLDVNDISVYDLWLNMNNLQWESLKESKQFRQFDQKLKCKHSIFKTFQYLNESRKGKIFELSAGKHGKTPKHKK